MPLTDAGRDHIATTLVGEAVTAFNNANAYLGVGDSSAISAKTQTDLQAAVNKLRKAMEATYPQRAANILTFRSLFGTSEANFAWEEWGVFNAAAGSFPYRGPRAPKLAVLPWITTARRVRVVA